MQNLDISKPCQSSIKNSAVNDKFQKNALYSNHRRLNLLDLFIELSEGYRQALRCSQQNSAFVERHDDLVLAHDQGLNDNPNQSNTLLINSAIDTTVKPSQHLKTLERLMRINHTGEICAQALYQGQMRFAQKAQVFEFLRQSKAEEQAHLGWCYQDIKKLNGRTSYLNPFWYTASYLIAAFLARQNDVTSLGFTYHTEEQVSRHLAKHLKIIAKIQQRLDLKSDVFLQKTMLHTQNILKQMQQEEMEHGQKALTLGGKHFSLPARLLMRFLSKIMTKTVYYI